MSTACVMFAGALLNSIASKKPGIGDWATWFAAVTTFVTLVMTIRLATSERRRRDRSERAFAVVSAAGFEIELADCVASLSNALAFVTAYTSDSGDFRLALKGCDMLVQIPPLRSKDAAQLIAIDTRLATELARAGSVLTRIQQAVVRPSNPFLPNDTARIVEFLSKEQECRSLLVSLEVCIEGCRKAQALRIE